MLSQSFEIRSVPNVLLIVSSKPGADLWKWDEKGVYHTPSKCYEWSLHRVQRWGYVFNNSIKVSSFFRGGGGGWWWYSKGLLTSYPNLTSLCWILQLHALVICQIWKMRKPLDHSLCRFIFYVALPKVDTHWDLWKMNLILKWSCRPIFSKAGIPKGVLSLFQV